MKLRNKKTGETMEGLELSMDEYGFGHEWMRGWSYNSIKAFMEDWEDVEENSTAEPLIKDEKVRKAVREWAKLNCSHELHLFNNYLLQDENNYLIEFANDRFTKLEVGKNYTIAELCGEEEE